MEPNISLNGVRCRKDTDHASFIPSLEFNVNHLPLPYQDVDLANCVTSMIDLSVAVEVRCFSESRPQFLPGTNRRYPFFSSRGRHGQTVGSGWVHTVYRFPDKYNFQHKTCPCKECLRSEIPNKHFAYIAIGTTTDPVFHDSDGEHTTCYLFYKGGSSPADCNDVIKLCGMWRVISDTISDRCLLIHVTHDMELAAMLDRMVIYRDYLKEIYANKWLLNNPPEEAQNDKDLLVILVSHPYGYGSHVSVGFERDIEDTMEGRIKYKNDTSTCPGCSGGMLFVVWKNWKFWGFEHTHSRFIIIRLEQEINCSSSGIGYLYPIQSHTGNDSTESPANSEPEQEPEGKHSTESPVNSEPDQEPEGFADVEECFAEAELQDKCMVCTKNPGHENFIPIHQFNEDHLPPGSRHLVEPIKALGNIVALVAVRKTSKERPMTFPGTSTPYPRTSLVATCWVYNVIRKEGRCQCEECQKSSEPRSNFADIIIHTAAHVVFDNSEAKHTTCYLFFDEGRNRASCQGVVQLSGMSHVWSDTEKDASKMVYVTHDPDLISRVENAVHEWDSARKSLECKKFIDETMLTSESSSVGVGHDKLAIAVSHPHGCSKQVSIGKCLSIDDKGHGHIVYTCTTPTCRGSSGAYVFVPGRERKSWGNMHIMGDGVRFTYESN